MLFVLMPAAVFLLSASLTTLTWFAAATGFADQPQQLRSMEAPSSLAFDGQGASSAGGYDHHHTRPPLPDQQQQQEALHHAQQPSLPPHNAEPAASASFQQQHQGYGRRGATHRRAP